MRLRTQFEAFSRRLRSLYSTQPVDACSIAPKYPRDIITKRDNRRIILSSKILSTVLVSIFLIQLIIMQATLYSTKAEPVYIYEKESPGIPWTDSFDIRLDFNVFELFTPEAQAVVDIHGNLSLRLETAGAGNCSTTILTSYYCNGERVKTVTETVITIGNSNKSCNLGLRNILIPSDRLRAGQNELLVQIGATSNMSNIRFASTKALIQKVEIHCNNYAALFLILLLGLSLWGVVWKGLPRLLRPY